MRYAKMVALFLLSLLLLGGCGSGSTTSTGNSPFQNNNQATIFGNISTATGKTGITLTTDRATVDVNNGQIVATAKVVSSGVPVANALVTFSIKSPLNGPATVDPSVASVSTDSNGIAISRITTGNALSTTSVIVQATTGIAGQTATATTTFQIVRGNGVIMFTSAAGTAAGTQTNQLPDASKEINDPSVVSSVTFYQQLPFKVTDSNGNPRVSVPVTLSVFSTTGAALSVVVDKAQVTTDSAGQGIFNVAVTMPAPPSGSFYSTSVIYKAATSDPIPITAYIGGCYSLSSKPKSSTPAPTPTPAPVPALTITPTTASFGTASDLAFVVSGGSGGYTVISSSPTLVTATVSGNIVTAQLVDTTQWTGSVSIIVTDTSGNVASVTVSRGATNPVTITPNTASFGSSAALTFYVSGGSGAYTVTSSSATLVTATVSGNVVTAQLVDTSQWTGVVTIFVTDTSGNVASAAVTR